MKLKKTLSAFGLVAVTATCLVAGPGASATEITNSIVQVDSAVNAQSFTTKIVLQDGPSTFHAVTSDLGYPYKTFTTRAEAEAAAVVLTAERQTNGAFTLAFVKDGVRYGFYAPGRTMNWWSNVQAAPHWFVSGGLLRNTAYPDEAIGQISGTYLVMSPTGGFQVAVGSALSLFSAAVTSVDVAGRSAVVSGAGAPGSSIIINDADAATVAANGTWTATVTGLRLGSNVLNVEAWERNAGTGDYELASSAELDATLNAAALDARVTFASALTDEAIVSGTAHPGATIEVRDAADSVIASATAHPVTGAWTASLPAPGVAGVAELQVSQSLDGEVAEEISLSADYGVGVVLDAPADGAVHPGGDITFTGSGASSGGAVELFEGETRLASVPVLANGRWTATVSLSNREHVVVAKQLTRGNNVTTATATVNPEADVEEQPLVVSSPTVGGSVVTDSTGRVAPVFSGTATPGAEVKVVTAWGDLVGTTTADAVTGAWSLTWNKTLLPNTYAGGATIQSIGGTVIDRVGYNFTVTGSLTQEPLVVTSPAVNGTIVADASGTVAPVFSGTATPGADVKVVTAWGDTVGTVTADATTGAWSLTWNKSLKPATYAGGNTIQSMNGVEIDRTGYRFTVQAAASDVVLSSPAIGGVISTGGADRIAPVFTGTGTEGARIEIVGAWGTALGSGVVRDGVWEITWANQYTPSKYSGGLVKQYLAGQTTLHSSVPYSFTITK